MPPEKWADRARKTNDAIPPYPALIVYESKGQQLDLGSVAIERLRGLALP